MVDKKVSFQLIEMPVEVSVSVRNIPTREAPLLSSYMALHQAPVSSF